MPSKRYIVWGILVACIGICGAVSLVLREKTPIKSATAVPKKRVASMQKSTRPLPYRKKKNLVDKVVPWMKMFPEAVNLNVYLQVKPKRQVNLTTQETPLQEQVVDSETQDFVSDDQSDNEGSDQEIVFGPFKRNKISYGACKETPLFHDTSYAGDNHTRSYDSSYASRSSYPSGGYASQARPSRSSGTTGAQRRQLLADKLSKQPEPSPASYTPDYSSPSKSIKNDWPDLSRPARVQKPTGLGDDVAIPDGSDEEVTVDLDDGMLDAGLDGDGNSASANAGEIDPALMDSLLNGDGGDGSPSSMLGTAKETVKKIVGPILGIASPYILNKLITPVWDSAYKMVQNWWNGNNNGNAATPPTSPAPQIQQTQQAPQPAPTTQSPAQQPAQTVPAPQPQSAPVATGDPQALPQSADHATDVAIAPAVIPTS